jgi:hypothetical protein
MDLAKTEHRSEMKFLMKHGKASKGIQGIIPNVCLRNYQIKCRSKKLKRELLKSSCSTLLVEVGTNVFRHGVERMLCVVEGW